MLHFFQQRQQRVIALMLVGSFLVSLLTIWWLVLENHRIRAAFMPVVPVTEPNVWLAPPAQGLVVYQENTASLALLQKILPPGQWTNTPNLAALQQLLAAFATLMQRHGQHQSALMPEHPLVTWQQLVKKDRRGSCYNDAILFGAMAQSIGFHTRLIEFAGSDGLGGSGHSALEVWLPDLQTWMFVDAQNLAYMTNPQGQPISALELRHLLFVDNQLNQLARYRVHQLPGHLVPKPSLLAFYQRAVDLYALRTADFLTVSHRDPAAKLAAFFENRASQVGLKALQAGRFVRSVAGRPFLRYRWVDATTPTQTFTLFFQVGRAVLAIWILDVLLLLGWVLSATVARKRHGSTATAFSSA